MADIYCSKCGEPWDTYTFHDIAEENGTDYRTEIRAFQARGCEATGWGRCSAPAENVDQTFGLRPQDAAAAMYDLLGDDIDGAAAMLEDMRF